MSADTAAAYFAQVHASPGWGRVLDAFVRFLAPQPGWRTLDAGCGPGALVRRLAGRGCDAAGLDQDPAMLVHAPPGAAVGDVRALPWAGASFDAVTATNVLFLLPEPLAGLREMARVARPGGWVAMLNPSPRMSLAAAQAHADALGLAGFERLSLVNWGAVAERHHRLNEAELGKLCRAAGLSEPAIEAKIGPGLALFAKARLE